MISALRSSALFRRLRNSGSSKQPAIIRPADKAREFDRYVFIAGMHRSGTTLIEHLLGARCDVTVLRADVRENEGQHLQDVVPAARSKGGPGRFAFSPEMHTPPAGPGEAPAQRMRLLACWTPWMEGEAPVLLEKSPPNLVRIPWLRSVFPGARFLIVTRDPRVSALATQKWSHTSVEEMIYHWHVAHSAALDAMGEDCTLLRYEDLCENPEGELDRVIAGLGLAPRLEALNMADRFAEIRSSNPDYLDRLPPRVYGPGVWDRLGYNLNG
jgi:hypothetical protein